MRWKLLIIASLAAAAAGFGLWVAVVLAGFGSFTALARHSTLLLLAHMIPLLAIASASLFVYRHTARRRKLQAALTATLALVLIAAAYLVASVLSPRLYLPHTPEVRQAG
jgi:hypothetical protein